ncbi:MAG TPA: hypothetical protein VJ205_01145 [Gammaproteobacteria bacterium]|nr:hypothetical protein [Gammaproteobacteria bacterium]
MAKHIKQVLQDHYPHKGEPGFSTHQHSQRNKNFPEHNILQHLRQPVHVGRHTGKRGCREY